MNRIQITQSITRRDEMTSLFFGDINKYKVLTPTEEHTFALNLHANGAVGEEARKMLIVSNIRFAVSIAKKYDGLGLPLADLIEEACVGLCRAVETFDPARNCRFITHAVGYIRGSIIEALEKAGCSIKVPHDINLLQGKYRRLCDKMYAEDGSTPTAQDFADYAKISLKKAQTVIASLKQMVSMDTPYGADADDDYTLASTIVGGTIDESRLDEDIRRKALIDTLKEVLSERDAKAVMAAFGLSKQTLNEIAYEYDATYDALRKAVERAILRIQANEAIMNRLMVFRGAA